MLLSTIATIFTASSAGLGVWQAQGRGMESYARLLNGIGLELRADQFYAVDLVSSKNRKVNYRNINPLCALFFNNKSAPIFSS